MTKFILLGLTAAALLRPRLRRRPGCGRGWVQEVQGLPFDRRPGRDRDPEGRPHRPEPLRHHRQGRGLGPRLFLWRVARGLGATGAVWDEASLAAYTAEPGRLPEDRAWRPGGEVEDVLQACRGRRGCGGLSGLGRPVSDPTIATQHERRARPPPGPRPLLLRKNSAPCGKVMHCEAAPRGAKDGAQGNRAGLQARERHT
jgi:hypothetical protein